MVYSTTTQQEESHKQKICLCVSMQPAISIDYFTIVWRVCIFSPQSSHKLWHHPVINLLHSAIMQLLLNVLTKSWCYWQIQFCVGPLVKSKCGYRLILTAIDFATSFVFGYPMREYNVYTWRNGYELAKIVFFTGPPSAILSDQGSIFLSRILSLLYENFAIVVCELFLITLRVTANLKGSIQPSKIDTRNNHL